MIWLLVLIFLILAIIGILYSVFYSDLFRVKAFNFSYSNNYLEETDSSGFFTNDYLVSSLTAEAVKERRFLGYLGPDNILFWVMGKNENLVNDNVLPSVDDLEIDTDLFKRKVDILVSEKKLSGIVCKSENFCCAFDDEGNVFAFAPSVKGTLIVRIDDFNERPLVFGEKFLPDKEWIENVVRTLEVIRESGFHVESASIGETSLSEWEVVVSQGPKFLFSLDFVPKDLKKVMETLKERADFSGIDYFDMRVENRIYYK